MIVGRENSVYNFGVVIAEVSEQHDKFIVECVYCSPCRVSSCFVNKVTDNLRQRHTIVLEVFVLFIVGKHLAYLGIFIGELFRCACNLVLVHLLNGHLRHLIEKPLRIKDIVSRHEV